MIKQKIHHRHSITREIGYFILFLVLQFFVVSLVIYPRWGKILDSHIHNSFIFPIFILFLVSMPSGLISIKLEPFRKWVLLGCTLGPLLSLILYKDPLAFLQIFVYFVVWWLIPFILGIGVFSIPVVLVSAVVVLIKRYLKH